MRPIAPRIHGADEITIAEEQPEYAPITAAIVRYESDPPQRVCRWTFTDEEREAIFLEGADIYFGTIAGIPLMPHWLSVGFVSPYPEGSRR
jgi:hypothetical protein